MQSVSTTRTVRSSSPDGEAELPTLGRAPGDRPDMARSHGPVEHSDGRSLPAHHPPRSGARVGGLLWRPNTDAGADQEGPRPAV
jgi:hypothetical protein